MPLLQFLPPSGPPVPVPMCTMAYAPPGSAIGAALYFFWQSIPINNYKKSDDPTL